MLGTLAREGPTTSNHKHIKKPEFTIKVTRAVNEDYKLVAGVDDEWVHVPDKTTRKNRDVQCSGDGIDAALDEGCYSGEDLKRLAMRTASALEESAEVEKKLAERRALLDEEPAYAGMEETATNNMKKR